MMSINAWRGSKRTCDQGMPASTEQIEAALKKA
jgi:hypothetical protein